MQGCEAGKVETFLFMEIVIAGKSAEELASFPKILVQQLMPHILKNILLPRQPVRNDATRSNNFKTVVQIPFPSPSTSKVFSSIEILIKIPVFFSQSNVSLSNTPGCYHKSTWAILLCTAFITSKVETELRLQKLKHFQHFDYIN